ncbi:MAG: repair protein SbcC/Rad50 [Chloroflexia bacterium]|nr:repair protein SbcC/Rad50 [Chloroflexia bacterium]
MIPIRLSLRNFMCYRDTAEVLDLTGVHLACLAGENGAGKSALLEAMTWSLWGRARDRMMDDELISKGATEMEIDFHFGMGSEHYRVIRKRARKGNAGTTMLDVMVSESGEESSWKTISGATVRESQQRINQLLKLDYETFINSAFILQGRADEFTVKNPADRKRILADILGLAQYDRLEEAAKEESRERKARMNELEGAIRQVDVELLKRPSYEQNLEEVEAQLLDAQENLSTSRAELIELQAQVQALDHNRGRLKELQERQRNREGIMLTAKARLENNTTRKTELVALLARREEIEKGYAEWQRVQEEERRLNEALASMRRLENEQSALERQIDGEKIRLESTAANHREHIRKLGSNLASRGVLENQLAEVLDKLRKLEQLQVQYEDTRCQRENLDVRMQTLTRELTQAKDEGLQLRQKLDLIMSTHAESNGHVGCPLCGADLTADTLRRVQTSYEDDIKQKRLDYDRKNKELEGINKQIVAAERKLTQEREDLKPLEMHRQREANVRAKISGLDMDEQQLAREEAALVEVRMRLDEGDYAHEARTAMLALQARMRSLAYDEEAHHAVSRRVATMRAEQYDQLYHRLQNAERELASVEQYIEDDTLHLDAWTAERAVDAEEIGTLLPKLGQWEIVRQQHAEKVTEEKWLAGMVSEMGEKRGGLKRQIEHCDGLQEEKGRYTTEYNKAVEEKVAYDELAVAFGKKGIQAMIIENIIPEVEEEANKLLHRMTDGRMTVQFATQRDAKSSKNVIETLDINISDEIGTRAYEMYSGGEAFRVNLAVRIALSKLLARRAGTQLQTLVIDEGFGSQDGQGREKLVSAIHSIEGDFERILVITHIEELKDEFPVRITIVKTPTGSRILMGEGELASAA